MKSLKSLLILTAGLLVLSSVGGASPPPDVGKNEIIVTKYEPHSIPDATIFAKAVEAESSFLAISMLDNIADPDNFSEENIALRTGHSTGILPGYAKPMLRSDERLRSGDIYHSVIKEKYTGHLCPTNSTNIPLRR